jgi:hypothetical protein
VFYALKALLQRHHKPPFLREIPASVLSRKKYKNDTSGRNAGRPATQDTCTLQNILNTAAFFASCKILFPMVLPDCAASQRKIRKGKQILEIKMRFAMLIYGFVLGKTHHYRERI